MNDNQDLLARAYAMLLSLRQNIGDLEGRVKEKYVDELHHVLDRMESIGIDVSEFRIPDSELAPRVTSIHTLTFAGAPAKETYSKEKYVEKAFILTKLDTVINYLSIITSEKPRKTGYVKD